MKKYFDFVFSLRAVKYATTFSKARPFTAAIISLVTLGVVFYGYSYLFPASTATTYTMGSVTRGTIVSTVSGSGQVSTSNKIDIKAKVSGDIVWVQIKPGDTVRQYQGLIGIDSTDAKKAVIDAQHSLEEARLQFQRDSAAAPIDYQKAADNLANAKIDLSTTYNDTYNVLSNTYLDLPTIMTGVDSILYGYDLNLSHSTWNVASIINFFTDYSDVQNITLFATSAKNDNTTARKQYDASILSFKSLTRTSAPDETEAMLQNAITTTTSLAQAVQSSLNLLSDAIDLGQRDNKTLPSAITTLQTSAKTLLTTANNDLDKLLSQKKALASDKQAIKSYADTISLLKVGNENGSNPISLQISKNNISSLEANLAKLQDQLNNYTITAPFDGTISSVPAVRGDIASGVLATIITNQKIAELTLNEVDAAKVSLGNKVTLSFDAIDELTLTGKVAEIDTVGTVSQGVVSYAVKINFDTQDDRIKSGMTVNASIQTETKQDVLVVPSSAVKTQASGSFVQIFIPAIPDASGQLVTSSLTPTQVPVEIGISDDLNVEIISGLTEGQQIIVKTNSTKTMTTTTEAANRSGGGLGGPAIRL